MTGGNCTPDWYVKYSKEKIHFRMISLVSPWWSYQSDGVGEYDWGPPGSEWSRPARPSPRWNTSQHPLRHHTHPSAPLRLPPAVLLRLAAGGNGSSRTSASQSSWGGRRKVENALVCSKIIWKLTHPNYCIFISIYNPNKNKKLIRWPFWMCWWGECRT